jgi:hypothetical protein
MSGGGSASSVDVYFMLQELGVRFRPSTQEDEEKLKRVFADLPYPVFVELAKLHNRPVHKGCKHCG